MSEFKDESERLQDAKQKKSLRDKPNLRLAVARARFLSVLLIIGIVLSAMAIFQDMDRIAGPEGVSHGVGLIVIVAILVSCRSIVRAYAAANWPKLRTALKILIGVNAVLLLLGISVSLLIVALTFKAGGDNTMGLVAAGIPAAGAVLNLAILNNALKAGKEIPSS